MHINKPRIPQTSVFVPTPLERKLTSDEERVVAFLSSGVQGCLDKIKDNAGSGTYYGAAEAQRTAYVLQTAIDALRAGLHDAEHTARIIDPNVEARLHFAGIR